MICSTDLSRYTWRVCRTISGCFGGAKSDGFFPTHIYGYLCFCVSQDEKISLHKWYCFCLVTFSPDADVQQKWIYRCYSGRIDCLESFFCSALVSKEKDFFFFIKKNNQCMNRMSTHRICFSFPIRYTSNRDIWETCIDIRTF